MHTIETLSQRIERLNRQPVCDLQHFIVGYVPDNPDPELRCDRCGEVICNVENGDILAVLARCALDHDATCPNPKGI
jgi:hypothetical protein